MDRPALLVNPHARSNKRDPTLGPRLAKALGKDCAFAEPDGLDALTATMGEWHRAGIDTVIVHGGDGTLHRTLTALVRAWPTPLPTLAIIPGGTMNIVASSLGIKGRPLHLARGLTDSQRVVRRWAMRIEGPPQTQYGFLFGNGIIARFLEVYYEGAPPTPAKAARILARGTGSALIRGPYIRKLTRPFHGTLTLGDQQWGPGDFTAIAAGTVEQIGLGFRAFPLSRRHPGSIHVVGVTGSVVDLALDLPRIYLGKGVRRPGNFDTHGVVFRLTSPEPMGFMIDGDFHTAEGEVQVSCGPELSFLLP